MQITPKSPFLHAAYAILSVAAFSALLAACTTQAENLGSKEDTKKSAPAFVGTPVDAAIVKAGLIKDELELTGTVVANQTVDIVSELTRRIERVQVKEGSRVRKGDLLFQLDDADLQAQLERFQQQEKLAKLNETRLRDLLEKEAVAQQDYDEAITNLHVLQAQIREVQVTIRKAKITAPFDGQIGIINVHPGAIVSVNTILTNIEDNQVVKIQFSVPEKYTNVIHLGSVQSFTTPAGHRDYTTKIVARSASLNEGTRSLLVRGLTENQDGSLVPGLSTRLRLSLGDDNKTLSIPSQAVIPSVGGYTVFVSHKNVVQPVPVEIGQRSASAIEILKGLNNGDTVVTTNQLRLTPGSPVHIVTIN
ncbi:MAG TPA: efflux RND transporter periplasmic adaptor subunit [Ohtaekwangia sp.]|uniref:efflux RND transporter periplasmic adaptor subunit n=1 Tax=Ohtaekwangia sp. TaxID=2066019 RepID=UPI002F94F0C9